MESIQPQHSEVARLLAQIQEEYESAVQGATGFSRGSSQHKVINQKMMNMYLLQFLLQEIVGIPAAMMLVDLQLQDCPGVNGPA